MKFIYSMAAAAAMVTMAPAANAAVFTPADTNNFNVSFFPDGSISANIGNTGINGIFEDTYNFLLLQDGIGSGGVIATFSSAINKITLTFASINGVSIPITTDAAGFTSAAAGNVALNAGANSIVIRGTAGTNSSYGGNVTFIPTAVPEPGTWAMMMVGFGMLGAATRYRRRSTKTVYA